VAFFRLSSPKNRFDSQRKVDRDGKETSEFKFPQLTSAPTDIRLLPLDIDASREIGFMLGAGIVVYGETADILDQTLACTRFYQRESCGKCVPCRLGSRKMADMAERVKLDPAAITLIPQFVENVNMLSRILKTTSICGLGQVASEPLRTYFRYFYHYSSDYSSEG
jgi:NADH:ubiquinone oxidoreductase subunit F (NADH-binding)